MSDVATELVPPRFRAIAGYYDASYPSSVWATTPVLASIEPASRIVGPTDDVVLHCYGSGFTWDSMIVFAGQEERTDFVSPGEVTTIIKGELFTGPDVVDVLVRTPGASPTDSANRAFEFTATELAEEPPPEPEPEPEPETPDE